MRSAVLRGGAMVVRDDVTDPVPALGQVLVEIQACGICGSDLHFARHAPTMVRMAGETEGLPALGDEAIDLDRDVFMGHEFAGSVLEVGPDTVAPPVGSIVTSVPVLLTPTGKVRGLAYTNEFPSGYGERMLLCAPLLETVPNGLDPRHAALTEPMAVGLHAVNRSGIGRSGIGPGDRVGALVLGCGPIGLAVIAALALKKVEPIVAADFSPARRHLAGLMGAHETVDPAAEPSFDAWARAGRGRPVVVFEAIGVPGILDDILRRAPAQSRVVVVGVCMERDLITPLYAIGKELALQFVLAYDPSEFGATLRSIAEGDIDVSPLITGEVGLDEVPDAFDALANPDEHCKILVVPGGSR
jgi:threonine dehydrogenase-like Zn-dependent dehydrogenase